MNLESVFRLKIYIQNPTQIHNRQDKNLNLMNPSAIETRLRPRFDRLNRLNALDQPLNSLGSLRAITAKNLAKHPSELQFLAVTLPHFWAIKPSRWAIVNPISLMARRNLLSMINPILQKNHAS
jgi:hypothetical protein